MLWHVIRETRWPGWSRPGGVMPAGGRSRSASRDRGGSGGFAMLPAAAQPGVGAPQLVGPRAGRWIGHRARLGRWVGCTESATPPSAAPHPAGGTPGAARPVNASLTEHGRKGIVDNVPETPGRGALEAITVAQGLARSAEEQLAATVARARESGHTWAEIGQILGTSRQAAFQRFGRPADPRTGRPMEPGLPRSAGTGRAAAGRPHRRALGRRVRPVWRRGGGPAGSTRAG